jgi:hypothetical protein
MAGTWGIVLWWLSSGNRLFAALWNAHSEEEYRGGALHVALLLSISQVSESRFSHLVETGLLTVEGFHFPSLSYQGAAVFFKLGDNLFGKKDGEENCISEEWILSFEKKVARKYWMQWRNVYNSLGPRDEANPASILMIEIRIPMKAIVCSLIMLMFPIRWNTKLKANSHDACDTSPPQTLCILLQAFWWAQKLRWQKCLFCLSPRFLQLISGFSRVRPLGREITIIKKIAFEFSLFCKRLHSKNPALMNSNSFNHRFELWMRPQWYIVACWWQAALDVVPW